VMRTNDVPADFAKLTGIDDLDRWPLRLILSEQHGDYATQERCLKLNDVSVPSPWRGRGVGTAALEAVCVYADMRAMVVWLVVHGSGDDLRDQARNTRRLVTWYRSLGFTDVSEGEAERYHMDRNKLLLIRHPADSRQRKAAGLPADVCAEPDERHRPMPTRIVWIRMPAEDSPN
jgi:GNAT superfamily N-acetyltransferase